MLSLHHVTQINDEKVAVVLIVRNFAPALETRTTIGHLDDGILHCECVIVGVAIGPHVLERLCGQRRYIGGCSGPKLLRLSPFLLTTGSIVAAL